MYTGPNIEKEGLVFGYDTGYGIADNSTATRFYKGGPTTNLVTQLITTSGIDGSGQGTIGVRTVLGEQHIKIVDNISNSRLSTLIYGMTGGATYTAKIEYKKISGPPTFRFQLQGYNGGSYTGTIVFATTAQIGLVDKDGWQTAHYTFTLPAGSNAMRWWYQDGDDYTTYTHSYEIKNPQLEKNSHGTPFKYGSRSSTDSLIDLKKSTNIDLSNVSFDSTGQPTFDGTDDYISCPDILGGLTSFTTEFVFFAETNPPGVENWLGSQYPGTGRAIFDLYTNGTLRNFVNGTAIYGITTIQVNRWYHAVFTRDINGYATIHLNGDLESSGTISTTPIASTSYEVGGSTTLTRWFNGKIPISKVYNKALTVEEVKQNFNAYKNRFNL